MRTLEEIRTEIEQLTEERLEILQKLSHGHDALLAVDHTEIEERIASLWDEHRMARAELRWGQRDAIIKRARAEERLDRAA